MSQRTENSVQGQVSGQVVTYLSMTSHLPKDIDYWSRDFGWKRLCSRFQTVLLRNDQRKNEMRGYWRHLL